MTDGANRALWIVIGLVSTALGVLGVLAYDGRLPFVARDEPLLPPSAVELWNRGDPWNAAIPIAAGLLLAVLGAVLLRKEFSRRGGRRIGDVVKPAEPGRTVVRATGLVHALETDVASSASIVKSAATLTGDADRPHVWLRVDLAPGAKLPEACEHVTAVLERFSATSGITVAKVDVTVRASAHGRTRVH